MAQVRENGSMSPNTRALTAPIMQLFHGAPGGKQWKCAVDGALKKATSVTQVRLRRPCG